MVREVRLDPADDLFGEGPDVILFFTFESINSFTVYLPDFFPILEALNCVIPSFPSLVLLIWRQILTSQFLVSSTPVKRMAKEEWDRGRDIKNDIVRKFFSAVFPDYFADATAPIY